MPELLLLPLLPATPAAAPPGVCPAAVPMLLQLDAVAAVPGCWPLQAAAAAKADDGMLAPAAAAAAAAAAAPCAAPAAAPISASTPDVFAEPPPLPPEAAPAPSRDSGLGLADGEAKLVCNCCS